MRRHFPKTLLLATLLGGVSLVPGQAQTAPPTDTPGQSSNPVLIITPAPTAAPPSVAQPAEKTNTGSNTDQATRDTAASAATMEADQAAFFEAHLAALHAGLTLTPDQEKLWGPLEQSIRGIADLQRKERRTAMTASSSGEGLAGQAGTANADEDPIATLKGVSNRMMDHGRAFAALADASGPLYGSLTDEQKHRLPILLDGLTPRRGPVARMVKGLLGDLQGDEADQPQGSRHVDRDQDRDESRTDSGRSSRMQRSDANEDRGAQSDDGDGRDRSSYGARGRYGMETQQNGRYGETGSLYGDRDNGRSDRSMRRGGYVNQDQGDD